MDIQNKVTLVTGGAGFIGSHLIEKLLELDNEVIVYDNFDSFYVGKEQNLAKCVDNPSFKLAKENILDFKTLSAFLKGIDVVFHLAAQPGVRFSEDNPWKTSRVNIEGTLNVLLAAKQNRVKKVIIASSSSVYGIPRYLPCDENHPTLPVSIYGASKLAAEKYCRIFARTYKLPVTVLRYHTVYGPRQRPDMAIYRFVDALLSDRAPIVYGDGNQTRDFTYVADIVDGTILAAQTKERSNQVFNLGGGVRTSVNSLLKLLRKILAKEEIVPRYDPPRSSDVSDTQADITKAQRILGYQPRTGLLQGLEAFISWYKSRKQT